MAELEKVKVTLEKLINLNVRLKEAVVTSEDVAIASENFKSEVKGEFKNILEASTKDD